MLRTLFSIAALASLTVGGAALPALAQSSAPAAGATMPTCAADDPVVWVNTSSHVYHMAGDPFYGKTKHGTYECRSAAVASHAKMASMRSSHASSMMGASPAPAVATPEAMGSPASTHHHHHHSRSASPAPDASPGAMATPTP